MKKKDLFPQTVTLPLKDIIITLRLDADQSAYLDKVGKIVTEKTGRKTNRTWVIMQMMRHGKASFEQHHGITTKKGS